jgi:uncharacterized protein YcbX
MPTATLTGLWIYPVKSCRGIDMTDAVLTPHGFVHDREWMVVRPDGRFVTQREEPRLALVETDLRPDALVLRAPALEALEVPFQSPSRTRHPATVWGDTVSARDEGARAAGWLGEFLEGEFRLVRWDETQRRPTDPNWTANTPGEAHFADAYPYLVLGEETLTDLNERLRPCPALPVDRFRTNLLITGLGVAGEDLTSALKSGDVEFRMVKPCTRCVMTTTDQQTGVRGSEPLRTLAGYRRDPRFSAPVFGQNAVLVRGAGRALRVGETFAAAS